LTQENQQKLLLERNAELLRLRGVAARDQGRGNVGDSILMGEETSVRSNAS
jgi:hypothetical protein